MDGINSNTTDDAVGNAGIIEGSPVVLIVEEFLGEELLEFKPSSGLVWRVVCFPVITSIIYVW